MALANVRSVALFGVDGVPVEIEADIGAGLPKVQLLGLPDPALHESRDRVKAAVRNSNERWPDQRVTLALSPAALPKGGTSYDLALACAVLAAAGEVPHDRLAGTALLGELALDGRLRPVRGVLPCLVAARNAGIYRAVVPTESLAEAQLLEGMEIAAASDLPEVLAWLRAERELPAAVPVHAAPSPSPRCDLADVIGQPEARWALEVAAAGGHHLLLVGPPGTGKTMLARRLSGLLPPLTSGEALEVAAIQSVAGELTAESPVATEPPYVAPHHSTSIPALIGGGSGMARPGSVSRAHRGVLLIDEACEMGQKRLEALRTALEEGEVRLARRDGIVRYPARCQLVLATNPCPCAPARDTDCRCSPGARRRYLGKLSGPLLDRVDLWVRMRPITAMPFTESDGSESSAAVRERVVRARQTAARRWADYGWRTNAEVPGGALRHEFGLSRRATAVLDAGLRKGLVTARSADRCLRVAWTLADLDETEKPGEEHVEAALQFRDRSAA